jgi:hypothetical protein
MERDGWFKVQEGSYVPMSRGWKVERQQIWERRNPLTGVILRSALEACDFRKPGGYVETFALYNEGLRIEMPGVNWADWDQAGRLVFTRSGQICVGKIDSSAIEGRVIADTNTSRPNSVAAPQWATKWNAPLAW